MPRGYRADGTKIVPPGGSRKGAPNKITGNMRKLVEGALDEAGERLMKRNKAYRDLGLPPGMVYLLWQAEKRPELFMSMLARLMPAKIDVNVTNMTNEVVDLMHKRRQQAIEARRKTIEGETGDPVARKSA